MRSPDQIGITWEENQLLMQQLREKAALEHRRQHNIFEVGDKVVFGSGLNAGLFTIKSKPKKKNGVLLLPVILPNGSWFDLMEQFVRHATDEEIKAGKRLEGDK